MSQLVVAALVGACLLTTPSRAGDDDEPERALGLETPAGVELSLVGFTGTEELSRLYRYDLEIVSAAGSVDVRDIVGQNVTFSVQTQGSPRYFNGYVSRFTAGDVDGLGRRTYHAEVVPWLWFLTRTTDSRVFQNLSVPQVVQQVAGELGFGDLRDALTATYEPRDCIVQYRESDFDFVSRLMEEVGIFYFFEHQAGRHTLVLTDSLEGAVTSPGCAFLPYQPSLSAPYQSSVQSWEHRYRFTSGSVTLADFNFMDPTLDLLATASTAVNLPGSDAFELYDYPGGYLTPTDGDVATAVRMEEVDAAHNVVSGLTNCRGVSPGQQFAMANHPSSIEDGTYRVTSVEVTAREPAIYVPEDGPDPAVFSSRFTCIPSSVAFRAERTTPKPTVSGLQTAIVVGPPGRPIHTDRYGRVKVRFHWDRESADENSSCWVRLAHDYSRGEPTPASIPPVGSEVVLSFLYGDPDRPLVIGRVHNAEAGVYTGDDARPPPTSLDRSRARPRAWRR